MKDSTALTLGSSAIVRRRIYFTMIEHPYRGWIRVGPSYGKRATAKGWLPFVRRSWHGLRGKVLSCPLVWRDGRLDEKSVRLLDSFNMDAPEDSANVADQTPAALDSANTTGSSSRLAASVLFVLGCSWWFLL